MTAIIFFIILFGIKQLIIIMKEDILNYSPTVLFSWDTLYIKPELLLERKKRSDLEA